MNPSFDGVLETLFLDLAGRRLRVVIERRGPADAPAWLLLPALSTVSSRSEWQPLAEAVQDQRQLVSFDWPGFGDSERPALTYDAELLRSCLRAILSYLSCRNHARLTLVAAGHSASIALGLASEWSDRWRRLVLVAPTWRGPLPTMTGWPPQRFGWLRGLMAAPLIGPTLYRLNTSKAVLQLMLRRHVWVNRALLTPERLREQQRLAHRSRRRRSLRQRRLRERWAGRRRAARLVAGPGPPAGVPSPCGAGRGSTTALQRGDAEAGRGCRSGVDIPGAAGASPGIRRRAGSTVVGRQRRRKLTGTAFAPAVAPFRQPPIPASVYSSDRLFQRSPGPDQLGRSSTQISQSVS